MATSCPVMALISELLPLFLLPKMPMCGLSLRPFMAAKVHFFRQKAIEISIVAELLR
jgi:hypothetical protein